ncbi:MAG: carboxymuconolactone decarboxylase family protein [Proteobacteria bacterium]|nr:carboxymuconolactone decarboxylase family protein [Pseudomonadota bacterium]MBU1610318.1 carboxymuconolactone decarboxylase family protein [Pseudomonadota bacterium]
MEFDDKNKSLIMLAAAKAVKCGPCLEHAVNWAIEAGCCEDSIAQALALGEKVREGAHKMMSEQADEQLAETLAVMGVKVAQPIRPTPVGETSPCACRA